MKLYRIIVIICFSLSVYSCKVSGNSIEGDLSTRRQTYGNNIQYSSTDLEPLEGKVAVEFDFSSIASELKYKTSGSLITVQKIFYRVFTGGSVSFDSSSVSELLLMGKNEKIILESAIDGTPIGISGIKRVYVDLNQLNTNKKDLYTSIQKNGINAVAIGYTWDGDYITYAKKHFKLAASDDLINWEPILTVKPIPSKTEHTSIFGDFNFAPAVDFDKNANYKMKYNFYDFEDDKEFAMTPSSNISHEEVQFLFNCQQVYEAFNPKSVYHSGTVLTKEISLERTKIITTEISTSNGFSFRNVNESSTSLSFGEKNITKATTQVGFALNVPFLELETSMSSEKGKTSGSKHISINEFSYAEEERRIIRRVKKKVIKEKVFESVTLVLGAGGALKSVGQWFQIPSIERPGAVITKISAIENREGGGKIPGKKLARYLMYLNSLEEALSAEGGRGTGDRDHFRGKVASVKGYDVYITQKIKRRSRGVSVGKIVIKDSTCLSIAKNISQSY